jgi:hypothetical protein
VQQYITTRRLSVYLGLRPKTMTRWPEKYKPPFTFINDTPHHLHADVNAWLAEPDRAHGFVTPPTIEQLISGELAFVLREIAGKMLLADNPDPPTDETSFTWRHIRQGRLHALQLRPLIWVVSVQSIEALLRARRTDALTYDELYHAIAVRGTTLHRAVHRGDLTLVADPDNAKKKRVVVESVLTLLKRLIPSHLRVSPEDWLDDRMHTTEPLLSVPETAERLGLIENDVRDLLVQGVLVHIRAPAGVKFWIAPDSIAAYEALCKPLTLEEKGLIFGAPSSTVSKWHAKGWLRCPLHQHEQPYTMYRPCMVAFLRSRCAPGVDPRRWIRTCVTDGIILWNAKQAGAETGITPTQLDQATGGKIPYIIDPGGGNKYDAAAVKRYMRGRS